MRLLHAHAVPRRLRMARDELLLVEDLVMAGALVDTDDQPDVFDRDGVTRCPDRYQGVIGPAAQLHPFVAIRRPGAQRRQLFAGEALDRPLVRGSMNTQVGDFDTPAFEPVVELLPRAETPPGQRVALDVLHAALDLALGPRPIGLAGPRREPVVAREVLEQRMPQHLALV